MTELGTPTASSVVIGVDAHKKTHTMVAVNQLGQRLGQVTVDATKSNDQNLWMSLGRAA